MTRIRTTDGKVYGVMFEQDAEDIVAPDPDEEIVVCLNCGWTDYRGELVSKHEVPVGVVMADNSSDDAYNKCPECYHALK